MRFIKSHALGNDYLVLCSGESLHATLVERICHRNKGLGSDGILEPVPASHGDYGLRIWNPDGSQAEKVVTAFEFLLVGYEIIRALLPVLLWKCRPVWLNARSIRMAL